MSEVTLIATDLGGTLIGNADEFSLYEEFGDRLGVYRAKYGAIWVACTGRSLRSVLRSPLFCPDECAGVCQL
jgi:hypothetical protein